MRQEDLARCSAPPSTSYRLGLRAVVPGVAGQPASLPIAGAPGRICLNPDYLEGLLGSEEGVGNYREDAQRLQPVEPSGSDSQSMVHGPLLHNHLGCLLKCKFLCLPKVQH